MTILLPLAPCPFPFDLRGYCFLESKFSLEVFYGFPTPRDILKADLNFVDGQVNLIKK